MVEVNPLRPISQRDLHPHVGGLPSPHEWRVPLAADRVETVNSVKTAAVVL
jgi:hypothetical protein